MSRKRLHVHSLPLVGLSLAGTATLAVTLLLAQGATPGVALVSPVWSQGDGLAHSLVQASPLQPPVVEESAGVDNQIVSDPHNNKVVEASMAGNTLVVQLALQNATKK